MIHCPYADHLYLLSLMAGYLWSDSLTHSNGVPSAGKSGAELGPTDWPQGCLGYAFNLLRPVQLGHRRQLMFSAFNQVLVSRLP
jgi:hypothetical protein